MNARVLAPRITVVFLFAALLAGCGGGNTSTTPPPPPPQFTIGGSVSALVGSHLVLQDNGGDNLTVSANGAFTFATPVTSGGAYSVTVLTQPSSPAQTCGVTSAKGTATANVTSVKVDCGHGEWTWMGGSNLANQKGVYGTLGTPAAGNIPGGLSGPASAWVDKSGNAWIFGGNGYDSAGTLGPLSDLWELANNQWAWEAGPDVANQTGVYGTAGTAASGNNPGARYGAAAWTDSAGNRWLFGGAGYDSAGAGGLLNDLWKYGNGQWTWMGGPDVADQKGVYGTMGTPSAANIPGARGKAAAWTDSAGNFWLFGGVGYDSAGTGGLLSDLWKYGNGEWTWMGGSDLANQKGVYGTMGTPSAANNPGARYAAAVWTDSAGNLWLFGGYGYDSAGAAGYLNDLWKYSNGEWTWMGGSDVAGQNGVYGTMGTPAAANVPGARSDAQTWTDAAGNLWLFGGLTTSSAGAIEFPNDLWKFSNGQWTWMGGSNLGGQKGVYGTMGTPNPANIPGARFDSAGWVDAQGNLWLFGGDGFDSAGTNGQLNGLWRYEP